MSKINILPPSVYTRISAGEVIDRPFSVVKELVENAIDAGATEIQVYIEQGGKQLVRVVDNGCGIERDDLHSAFLPHATSKLAKADDLWGIQTLGFRGEAVASIASVSKMTIISKTQDGKCYSLRSDCGNIGEIREEASTERGTDVRVEALFCNTPVRFKTLRKERTEEAEITTYVSRFILARADIAFTYYVNGKKILQSFGDGDEEAFLCVYGASALRECIKLDAERHGMRLYGYIGNQNFFKPNKTYQTVFVNGRYVSNPAIASAVSSAYQPYLMKRQYPFYVLHIELPFHFVDVNVHPNKTDVRFAESQIIYGVVKSTFDNVLAGTAKAVDYVAETKNASPAQGKPPVQEQGIEASSSISQSILEQSQAEETDKPTGKKDYMSVFKDVGMTYEQAEKELEPYFGIYKNTKNKQTSEKEIEDKGFIPMSQIKDFDSKVIHGSMLPPPVAPLRKKDPAKLLEKFPETPYNPVLLDFNDSDCEMHTVPMRSRFEENKRYLQSLDGKAEQGKIAVDECVYAGKLFNTYLLYEYNNTDVYIIDQHAAHERLIFDNLKEQMRVRYVVRQPMLVPFQIQLNAFEATFIRERMDDLWEIGFRISEWGETGFEVNEIPVNLQDIDLSRFFNEILSEVNGYRAIKLEELLKDKLAAAACKAAVKGGMDLTRKEVEELLSKMDGNISLKCPHGRPVVVRMTKKEIEKMFKRIL